MSTVIAQEVSRVNHTASGGKMAEREEVVEHVWQSGGTLAALGCNFILSKGSAGFAQVRKVPKDVVVRPGDKVRVVDLRIPLHDGAVNRCIVYETFAFLLPPDTPKPV